MLETPQITQTAARQTAVIHVVVAREEIQKAMDPAIHEVIATLQAQGIAPAGPLFSYHLRMDPATFDFEVGFPVPVPVAAAGRVKPGHLPAARVARVVYQGPYEGLGAAWGEFGTWIAANGYKPAPTLWECYLTNPEENPDPATFRTELYRPLLD